MDPTADPTADEARASVPRLGRRPRQRVFVAFNLVLAVVTIAAGSGLLWANWKLGTRQVVAIDVPLRDGTVDLPEGDLSAKNYLITGSDNNTCIDPDSPYAGGFGDRTSFGERSDSIMVIRVEPRTETAAVLSFPRDLWVTQAGSTRKNRINANFNKKDPNRLIRTIGLNFGIPIDHYVNIDFCTFKDVVDAVGGVRVPFKFKARDKRTGFQVLRARVCATLAGDHALAYIRSRKYEFYDPAVGRWTRDGTSDWGRISRQQDFIKRMTRKALDKARTNPKVASDIMNAALDNVITDDRITPIMMLQLAQAMKNYDAETMGSYTMPGTGQLIDEMAVIVPELETETAKKILALFQGKASLSKTAGDASTTGILDIATVSDLGAALEVVTLAASPNLARDSVSTAAVASPSTTSVTTTTLPAVVIEQNPRGIVPENDPTCPY
ncbi:MAG: LCP family protein [Ilumatobacteraceae bacterium]